MCDTCGTDCWTRCECRRGSYRACEYASCYGCYEERTAELVVCILCGIRRHYRDYPCCYRCRTKTRDDAATALRYLIHNRDRWTCQECGGSPTDMEVDHIVPCRCGGTADEWNLQLLCRTCNQRKSDAWWVGCKYEDVKTSLCRRYFLTPGYFDTDTRSRFMADVHRWRLARTWDPITWRTMGLLSVRVAS